MSVVTADQKPNLRIKDHQWGNCRLSFNVRLNGTLLLTTGHEFPAIQIVATHTSANNNNGMVLLTLLDGKVILLGAFWWRGGLIKEMCVCVSHNYLI